MPEDTEIPGSRLYRVVCVVCGCETWVSVEMPVEQAEQYVCGTCAVPGDQRVDQ